MLAHARNSFIEMRRSPRRRVLEEGIIAFNNRHCSLQCRVPDLSAGGVKLEVESCVSMPDIPRAAAAAADRREQDRQVEDALLALLLALEPEVFRTSILIAACAGLANALWLKSVPARSRLLITFYPRDSAKLMLASSRIGRSYPASPLTDVLTDFHSALSKAKQSTLEFAAASFAPGDGSEPRMRDLASRWSKSAAAGARLLRELHWLIALHCMSEPDEERDALLELLDDVDASSRCLLDPEGGIRLPQWAERRQMWRVCVLAPAVLIEDGRQHAVVVRDMSPIGLGIEHTCELASDIEVAVDVGQLRLTGTVIWSEQGRAGIKLTRPLSGPAAELAFCTRLSRTDDPPGQRW
jgi:hypothetical protein